MKQLLQTLILDFQNAIPDAGIGREMHYEVLPKKAFICIGVRRCGKSTLLYQIADKLLQGGASKENLLYINFMDDRLQPLKQNGLEPILDAYFSLYPEKKQSESVHFFFDEIQEIPGWELFITRVLHNEKGQVYITGSSSRMLSKEIATEMRGRSVSWELFPFSFSEFLVFNKTNIKPGTSKNNLLLNKAFLSWFKVGGFPETITVSDKLRIKVHQEYFQTILLRDVIERNDAAHPRAVMDLAHRLLSVTGSLYTCNRLYEYLVSIGHKISKDFISDVLQWMEDAYFLFSVKLYSRSIAKQNTNPKKIYCVDHAFPDAIHSSKSEDLGHRLESAVFMRLRSLGYEIFYYKTEAGKEIDFIAKESGKIVSFVQVSLSLADKETKEREVDSLFEGMKELSLSEGTIVTLEESDEIRRKQYKINIVPAWRWFLE